MGFEYVSVEEAIGRDGLRMVVVGQVPSPWGEAAKGLFPSKASTGSGCAWPTTARRCGSGRELSGRWR